ncbi:methyltransferase domain-containing protein [Mycolicibacterium sp. 22603]|uniref:methyltransferase domain-containing protein n=1 Tax=Mycolicibacterium sp. 22603 TaxID=3453950 RepID=UPI003F824184
MSAAVHGEPADPAALVQAWDDQQSAYIAGRESRFRAITDIVGLACGAEPVIVDLACGPGSLSARILDALPGARVVALDFDPLLLDLATGTLGSDDRFSVVEADLAGDTWPDAVAAATAGAPISAFVSTTALHWLAPQTLLSVYTAAAEMLSDNGILLNGDHFRFDGRQPTLRRLAEAHDAHTQARAHAAGSATWDQWWATATARDGVADLAALRDERFAHRNPPPTTAVDFHLAALAQAGFAEVGTVWQLLDDYVVMGVK